MSRNFDNLKIRTQKFALSIIALSKEFKNDFPSRTICHQVVRSATSVGANYRAACRARSNADFISKITIVEEEADETLYWLEIAEEAGLINPKMLIGLKKEAAELTAIFTRSGQTAKANKK
jgi:four helix bundle protein